MLEFPRLLDYIDPSLKIELSERISPELRALYEERLHEVKRWGRNASQDYGDNSYLPIREGFEESDLEHTCGMLQILQDLRDTLVYLPQEISVRDATIMIILHDSGEIVVGDVPGYGVERQNQKNKKRKKIEPKAAEKFILEKVQDEEIREEFRRLYHRFQGQAPGDREAILTKWLDKLQGTTFVGVKNVFDFKSAGQTRPSQRLVNHVSDALDVVVATTITLARACTPYARREVLGFAHGEIGKFNSLGYNGISRTRQDLLLWTMSGHLPAASR